jgi:isopentenyldiphosphate isomerase
MKAKLIIFSTIIGLLFLFFISIISALLTLSGEKGSLIVLAISCILAFILSSAVLLLSPERRNMIAAILSGKRSSQDFNTDLKTNFSNEIFRNISTAKNEVTFIGGIGSTFLNPESYQIFSKALIDNPKLRLNFYYESLANLEERSIYLTKPFNNKDLRTIDDLTSKYQDHQKLKDNIINRSPNEYQNALNARIELKEVHLQLYMTLVKIDDIIYYTPTSNRRGSNSICTKLKDTKGPIYSNVNEYLAFIKNEDYGGLFCTSPSEEIIANYDSKGNFIKNLPRTSQEHTDFTSRVVFGFVFNNKGELLIQKRSENVMDNNSLWDKSFGGHVNSLDSSSENTVIRELKEELFSNYTSVDPMPYSPICDCYPETGYFKLVQIDGYQSIREVKGSTPKTRNQIVDVFCFILNNSPSFIPDAEDVESVNWIKLDKLEKDIKENPSLYSNDLSQLIYGQKNIFSKLNLVSSFASSVKNK